jgi:hypothetical protein
LQIQVRVREVSGYLGHPLRVRLTRDAGDLDGASLELHNEEDNEAGHAVPDQHFDGEEVRGRQGIARSDRSPPLLDRE